LQRFAEGTNHVFVIVFAADGLLSRNIELKNTVSRNPASRGVIAGKGQTIRTMPIGDDRDLIGGQLGI